MLVITEVSERSSQGFESCWCYIVPETKPKEQYSRPRGAITRLYSVSWIRPLAADPATVKVVCVRQWENCTHDRDTRMSRKTQAPLRCKQRPGKA